MEMISLEIRWVNLITIVVVIVAIVLGTKYLRKK